MSKTLIGMVTFGNYHFTEMTINSIKRTAKNPVDILVIVGKPYDELTKLLCESKNIHYISHDQNYGFPYSCNDIYDFAWKEHDYDNLIFIGNDVVVYPNAIDILIKQAETTDFEWIAGAQFDSRSLIRMYPETETWFHGDTLKFDAFDKKPWEAHKGWPNNLDFVPDRIPDLHNFCLLKKSVFDKIGYNDVSFYPAYFEDNDYVTRGVNVGVNACYMINAVFFHFWSRTIHQGTGGSDPHFFENNRQYFIRKWGATPPTTPYKIPFNGIPYNLTEDIILPATLKIDTRENEKKIIAYWRMK
jgi:GT2 family glycosyltransferase